MIEGGQHLFWLTSRNLGFLLMSNRHAQIRGAERFSKCGVKIMRKEQRVEANAVNEQRKEHHHCRGCGELLSPGFRGHFHKVCLQSDKRSRVRGLRRREQERFNAWLQRQRCQKCGAKYGDARSEAMAEASCEASRSA